MTPFSWMVLIPLLLSLLFSFGYGLLQNNAAFSNRYYSRSSLPLRSSSDLNPATKEEYDLIVVGGGPVGVEAALVAANKFEKRVCLVDAPKFSGAIQAAGRDLSLGGPTGLFSKALRDTSKRINVEMLRGIGLREDSVWNEIVNECLRLATANVDDKVRQLRYAGVEIVEGFAKFDKDSCDNSSSHVSLNVKLENKEGAPLEKTLQSKHILLATGSKPYRPDNIPFDGRRIFDSDSINSISYLPRSIAITGSGIIAIEYAKIFRNLGAEVHLIIRDKVPRNALMKCGLDKDVAATLVADLVRSGIHIQRGAQVKSFEVPKRLNVPMKIVLEAKGGGERPLGCLTEIKCDCYIAAVGRVANTEHLCLDAIGVDVDDFGCITCKSSMQTTNSLVYAAGDVLGRPFLASTGIAQGVAAVEFIYSAKKSSQSCDVDDIKSKESSLSTTGANFDPKSLALNPSAFPVGIWSSPEASFFGLSTQQAKEYGIDAGEGIALYSECLRGVVFSPNGLLKLVFDRADKHIIGVHIVGDDACELIHYGMELVRSSSTLQEVTTQVYTAVTFHELYKIAALAGMDEAAARKRRAAAGKALSRMNRRKAAERQ